MDNLELISKYIKGEITGEERESVERWIKAERENAVLFNELKATWEATGKIAQITIDKKRAWESIQQKIKEERKVVSIVPQKTNYKTWALRIAAILVIGFFITFLVTKNNHSAEWVAVQTTDHEQMVTMPDSTKILLNKNSKLSYPKEFAENTRNVELEGEAFFEVTKNPGKPFIIKNKNFNVKVLGTSFNVLAYPENKEDVVTVVTGKVAFTSTNGNSISLVKNEVGILNRANQQLNKKTNLDSNFLSWKTKKLEFNNTDFSEVVKTLEKYFSKSINVKDSNILNYKFTGYFENPTLQDILNVLEKTLPIKTTVSDQQIIIAGAKS